MSQVPLIAWVFLVIGAAIAITVDFFTFVRPAHKQCMAILKDWEGTLKSWEEDSERWVKLAAQMTKALEAKDVEIAKLKQQLQNVQP